MQYASNRLFPTVKRIWPVIHICPNYGQDINEFITLIHTIIRGHKSSGEYMYANPYSSDYIDVTSTMRLWFELKEDAAYFTTYFGLKFTIIKPNRL